MKTKTNQQPLPIPNKSGSFLDSKAPSKSGWCAGFSLPFGKGWGWASILCIMLSSLSFGEGWGEVFSQNIGINTTGATPNSSALLDVDAAPNNNKGLLLPRMNTAERDAISSPATGLYIYNTDCSRFNVYTGSAWKTISFVGDNLPGAAGTITGTTTVCQGQTGVSYTISSVTNASGYVWSYTGTGFSIASGTNTNAIMADFSATATDGNLTVYATNACESGSPSPVLSITINVLALAPVATAATNLAATSFDANWDASAGASTYYLDVSTASDFSSFVTGYQNLNVGNVLTYGVTGLSCGTPYYYRVRAGNACGAGTNSNTITATPTTATPDVPTANAATSVTGTSFAANWAAATGATKYYLDVATDAGFTSFVTGYNGLDVGNVVTYSVSGLTCGGTNYYYQVRAANPCGTSASSSPAITVTTGGCCGSPITDARDGKTYNTVLIGTQCWLAQNLDYDQNAYGTDWCYNNDCPNYEATYGRLYDWAATMQGAASSSSSPSGVQGVCPTGWHVPSDAEWTTLRDYLGGASVAGGKLKEAGTTHWIQNTGADNSSGFTALPDGYRVNGIFSNVRNHGYWWGSTEWSTDGVVLALYYFDNNAYITSYSKDHGFSVRCVKD